MFKYFIPGTQRSYSGKEVRGKIDVGMYIKLDLNLLVILSNMCSPLCGLHTLEPHYNMDVLVQTSDHVS